MVADQKPLTQTLLEFGSTLVRDFTISDVLHDLAERAAAVAGAAAAPATAPPPSSNALAPEQETALPRPRKWPKSARSGAQVLDAAAQYRRLAEELAKIGMVIAVAERACCCPARPVVRVVMPTTASRPEPVDLLLCGHHYRAGHAALLAAGAAVYDDRGVLIAGAPAGRRPRLRTTAVAVRA